MPRQQPRDAIASSHTGYISFAELGLPLPRPSTDSYEEEKGSPRFYSPLRRSELATAIPRSQYEPVQMVSRRSGPRPIAAAAAVATVRKTAPLEPTAPFKPSLRRSRASNKLHQTLKHEHQQQRGHRPCLSSWSSLLTQSQCAGQTQPQFSPVEAKTSMSRSSSLEGWISSFFNKGSKTETSTLTPGSMSVGSSSLENKLSSEQQMPSSWTSLHDPGKAMIVRSTEHIHVMARSSSSKVVSVAAYSSERQEPRAPGDEEEELTRRLQRSLSLTDGHLARKGSVLRARPEHGYAPPARRHFGR